MSITNPYRYGGKVGYYTGASGNLYVRARHLNSMNGRWTSRDPVQKRVDFSNPYIYVANSPTRFLDPSGKVARSSPIGGPQSYEECTELAESAYQRRLVECKQHLDGSSIMSNVEYLKCLARANAIRIAALEECVEQEAFKKFAKCYTAVRDVCNNKMPGTGQPIFGGLPTKWPVQGPFGPLPCPVPVIP